MDFGFVTIILPNAPIRLLNIFMTHPPHPPPLPSLEVNCHSIFSSPSRTPSLQRLIPPPFPLNPYDPPKIFIPSSLKTLVSLRHSGLMVMVMVTLFILGKSFSKYYKMIQDQPIISN